MIALLLAAAFGYGSADFDAITNGPPPSRYTGDATITVTFTNERLIAHACDDDANPSYEGCALIGAPRMWVLNPCGINESYAKELCHEIAHSRGWPANHPK